MMFQTVDLIYYYVEIRAEKLESEGNDMQAFRKKYHLSMAQIPFFKNPFHIEKEQFPFLQELL